MDFILSFTKGFGEKKNNIIVKMNLDYRLIC